MTPRCALAAAFAAAISFAAAAASAQDDAGPSPRTDLSEYVDGVGAEWGKGDASPVEVDGSIFDLRPVPRKDPKKRESDDDVGTRVAAVGLASFCVPYDGRVGNDPLQQEFLPRYKDGWNTSSGGALQFSFDSGFFGVFVETGYLSFLSRGRRATSTGWYEWGDIRIATICPGFKLQFPEWLKYLHSGETNWEITWFDYMLHSFPYVKLGVGPIYVDKLTVTSDSDPVEREYWSSGLSYTFFFTLGIEWRPFDKRFSLLLEAGAQAFVFTTETARSKSPDMMVVTPVRLGLSISF